MRDNPKLSAQQSHPMDKKQYAKRSLMLMVFCCLHSVASAAPNITLLRTGIQANEVALLVNDDDPLSRRTATYYQEARHIPEENVIHLHVAAGKTALSTQEFSLLKDEIDRLTPKHIQAYAVVWTQPYRVDCMSLTSALAFGFNKKYCSTTCGPTEASGYFNSSSTSPFNDHKLRPAMMLAGTSFEQVKALIDRGVAADNSFPEGTAYLLKTSDKARNVRAGLFKLAENQLQGAFPVKTLESESIADRKDVMFYFTGLASVPHLETLAFRAGALADHLTSFGGQLSDSKQMSSLRWLEAGATASYGTVTEPCNHVQKFPVPAVAMFHYLQGATAIEAYWKSVAWPGEGIFIGEPLAKPFAPLVKTGNSGQPELLLFSTRNTFWRFEQADSIMGPYQPISRGLPVQRGKNVIQLNFPANIKSSVRLQR